MAARRDRLRVRFRLVLVMVLTSGALLAAGQEATSPPPQRVVSVSAGSATPDAVRRWDDRVRTLTRAGDLVLRARQGDGTLPGRVHEHFAQLVDGVPVLGAGVSRQRMGGTTVSVFGTVHEELALDTTPALSATEAGLRLEQAAGARLLTPEPPRLVILPLPDGSYALTYQATLSDLQTYFVDADHGTVRWTVPALREQTAVGTGTGIVGDRKKLSVTRMDETFRAIDRLRPSEIVTLDLQYDEVRLFEVILPPGASWAPGDTASDADNRWEDNAAAVDGHVHLGWAVDYLAARHGHAGLDGANGRILSVVNIDRDLDNAFFAPPPLGPEGTGVLAYGEFEGRSYAVEDVVAHEAMHGVVHFTVRQRTGEPGLAPRLIGRLGPASFPYEGTSWTCRTLRLRTPDGVRVRPFCQGGRFVLASNESWAAEEAFADIAATGVEFFHHEPGTGPLAADYLLGEDAPFGPFRSLENPRSLHFSGIPRPDAYNRAFQFLLATPDGGPPTPGARLWWMRVAFVDGQFAGVVPTSDDGGVHLNATILGHAFYLAVEGGTNATTGRTVAGVGAANRPQIERVFFRAITTLMPVAPSFQDAAGVLRQAAVDLFGVGSPPVQAVDQALRAVGL